MTSDDVAGALEVVAGGEEDTTTVLEVVDTTFEVFGTRSGVGRMYASGTATLGGYFPGVDTFLGLQIAAQEIADDLARNGFCPRMGPLRSTQQWWLWATNKKI